MCRQIFARLGARQTSRLNMVMPDGKWLHRTCSASDHSLSMPWFIDVLSMRLMVVFLTSRLYPPSYDIRHHSRQTNSL